MPACVDNTNFRYLKVDNLYISSINIYDYPNVTSFLEIMESIPKKFNYDMSIYIRKRDVNKVLKELTYHISSFGSEIKTAKQNQIDIDILNKVKNDATQLRKEIQINNEQIYYLNIYITFYSKDKEELLSDIKIFQNKLYSKGLISNITNFRHLDSYLLTLPLCDTSNKLLNMNYRNITTKGLSNIFPFYTTTIFDKYGVIFGYTSNENKIFNIDIFENKYFNSNMCIFGSSGSGKSFFVKLIIQRHFLMGKVQYIIDPEGEYRNISETLNGEYIDFCSSNNGFNILQITENEIIKYGERVIDKKIEKITSLIVNILKIEKEELQEKIQNAIKQSYIDKEIIDIENLYMPNSVEKVYVKKVVKNSEFFPTIKDVAKNIVSKKLLKKFKEDFIDKYPSLCDITKCDMENKLWIFDTSKIDINTQIYITDFLMDYIYDNIDEKLNTIIYIDELWKYVNQNLKFNLSQKIFTFYKTIRKKNASIVTITQEISDLFDLGNGSYAKSILNNSAFKLIFKMDYSDIEILKKLSIFKLKDFENIKKLDKGECMLIIKNNTVNLKIKASNYEYHVIKGGKE